MELDNIIQDLDSIKKITCELVNNTTLTWRFTSTDIYRYYTTLSKGHISYFSDKKLFIDEFKNTSFISLTIKYTDGTKKLIKP